MEDAYTNFSSFLDKLFVSVLPYGMNAEQQKKVVVVCCP
jgi:hypothetical protein